MDRFLALMSFLLIGAVVSFWLSKTFGQADHALLVLGFAWGVAASMAIYQLLKEEK